MRREGERTAPCQPSDSMRFLENTTDICDALPAFIRVFRKAALDDVVEHRGASGWRVEMEGGVSFRMAPITLAGVSPANGRVPVVIS